MKKNSKKIIGFLCSLAFCTAVAVSMPQMTSAAEEVAIDETNFPDEIFRNYINNNCDTDNNGKLSEEEMKKTRIDVSNKGIKNLKGIEYFTALTDLDCYSNQLTSLDISKNTALTDLDCYSNQLTSLDVSKNTALTDLDCYSNQLTSLDISKNVALTDLDCYSNQLTKLDVSNNAALTILEAGDNLLTELNVQNNTALTWLDCSCNELTELNLRNNTALTELGFYNNQLTELDVSNNINLIDIDCPGNPLVELDLSNNTALTYLYCSSDKLVSINLTKNKDLIYLRCYGKQLTSLDLSENTALEELDCSYTSIISLDLSKNTALKKLNCSYSKLTELKLNSQTYDKLLLYKGSLHGADTSLSDLHNITETVTNNSSSLLKVTDITKPATYKANGKDCTIIYTDTVVIPSAEPSTEPSTAPSSAPIYTPVPSTNPTVSPDTHIFNDYDYNNPVTGSAVTIYGNGKTQTVDDKKVNNKVFTAYTDILASYNYTLNSKGIVKPSVGKVIVGITKSNMKPEVNSKNKITDTSASKIAKATIKNGQIIVTAVGKEGGLVYLWVIDTGNKGVSACCPINVKLAPKKLEIQDKSGSKLAKNTNLENGKTLDVCVAGLVGQAKTEDGTYTATVDSKYQSYVTVTPVNGSTNQFTIKATGLKNNKDTKVAVTFKCDQNGKKTNLSLTITK